MLDANNNDEEEVRVGVLLFWGLIGGWSFGKNLKFQAQIYLKIGMMSQE